MDKYLVLLLLAFSFMAGKSNAQQSTPQKGRVEIIQDYRIAQLVDKHDYLNQQFESLEGYRIQIFFDSGNNSKSNAMEAKEEFYENFYGARAYISFKEPYYRVRVGDFRTRLDAEGYLQKIIKEYPHAFTVKDHINYPPLSDEDFQPELQRGLE